MLSIVDEVEKKNSFSEKFIPENDEDLWEPLVVILYAQDFCL